MSEQEHKQVRHDPESGDIAVNLGKQINGAGQQWLLVHLDDRGDVIATALDEHVVADWPELSTAAPTETGNEPVDG